MLTVTYLPIVILFSAFVSCFHFVTAKEGEKHEHYAFAALKGGGNDAAGNPNFLVISDEYGLPVTLDVPWFMREYIPGKSYIPSVTEIPTFLSGKQGQWFKSAHPNIPSIPFSLYSHGMEYNGTTFPALLKKAAEVKRSTILHVAPIEVEGVTKPALSWMQIPQRFDSYDDFLKMSYTPAQLTNPTPDQKKVIDLHEKMFTDSNTAEEHFLDTILASIPLNGLWAVRKIAEPDKDLLTGEFEVPDTETEPIIKDGSYYLIDIEIIGKVKPHSPDSIDAKYSVGAKVLLKKNKDSGVLIPVIIKLLMLPDRDDSSKPIIKVFNKATSTDSAWRLAILSVRASFTQWGIVAAHFLPMHVTVAAFQQGVFNNFSPTHKLRKAMDPFLLYTMQFNNMALLHMAKLYGLPYFNDAPNYENFYGVFKAWDHLYDGIPFSGQLPSDFFNKHGLKKEDFTKKDSWDQLPIAEHAEETERITQKFAKELVDSLYDSDFEIELDIQLQKFFQAAKDPNLLNMGNLLPNNPDKLSTKKELVRIINTYFYQIVTHGFSRLDSYSEGGHTIPYVIPAFSKMDFMYLDDKTTTYSNKDIIEHMPPAHLAGGLIALTYFFLETTPQDNFGELDDLYNGDSTREKKQRAAILHLSDGIRQLIKREMGEGVSDEEVEKNLRRIPRNNES